MNNKLTPHKAAYAPSQWKHDFISEIADNILKQGFNVFIAKGGAATYGFYTDKEGSRVISFQLDLLSASFSGNYITDAPAKTGTGWQIKKGAGAENDYKAMFAAYPPTWATQGAKWRFETLQEHLKRYQWSSDYKEVTYED